MQGVEAEEGRPFMENRKIRRHQDLNCADFIFYLIVVLSHMLVLLSNIIMSLFFHTSPSPSPLPFCIPGLHTVCLSESLFASPNCGPTSFPSGYSVRGIIPPPPPGFSGRVRTSNILFQCSHKHPRSCVLIFGKGTWRPSQG